MGGALSLQAAAETRPDGLILLAPFWKIDLWLWRVLPVLQPVFRKVKVFSLQKLDFDDEETRKGIHNYIPGADLDDPSVQQAVRDFAMPTRVINEVRRAGLAGHQRAPGVRARTLVLQGTEDDTVTPKLTRQLITALPTPPRYIEVREGHLINDDGKASWPAVERETLELAARLLA
jgi:pimeloyl-ACP methyl ester carboxylesterase